LRDPLHLYGLSQPKIIYTDNVSDRPFLEQTFPSLLENVTPVEKYSELNAFDIPGDVTVFVKATASSINHAIGTILDDVPDSETNADANVVVGFDSEWNVEMAGDGRVVHRGHTAVVQIAYQKRVYILQVSLITTTALTNN